MAKSYAINVQFVVLERIVSSVALFVLIPVIIGSVGEEQYGYWTLLISITSYYPLVPFGLTFSFERFIASMNASGDTRGIRSVICSSFYTLAGFSVLIVATVMFFERDSVAFFTDSSLPAQYPNLFLHLSVVMCLQLVSQIFLSVPRGLQRFDVISMCLIGARLAYVVVVAWGLAAGHGLYALLWASLAFHGLSGVCGLVITRAYVGTFSLAPALFSVRTLRILYGFGLKVQVSTVALWVAQNFDKLLISKFLGLTYVTYYAIGTRLVYLLRELPMLSFAVLIPKASEMSARNEMEGLKRLYVTGTWAVIAFCAACVGALAVPAYSVLALWLRTAPHPLSVYTFNVVLVGALCHVTSGFACSILRGMGRLKYEIAGNSVMAAANVVFSTLLMFAFGFKGVVLGTLIAFLISPLVLLPAANRLYRLDNSSPLRT